MIKTPKLLKFQVFGIIETLDSIIRHGISKKVAYIRYHLRKVSKEGFVFKKKELPLFQNGDRLLKEHHKVRSSVNAFEIISYFASKVSIDLDFPP